MRWNNLTVPSVKIKAVLSFVFSNLVSYTKIGKMLVN
jgi:hypothetical protein